MIDATKPLDADPATMPLGQSDPKLTEGGQPGNQNALKYDTPEKRQSLCVAYCDHKRRGYSDASFKPCNIKTLKEYRQNYPVDFPSDMIEEAEREYNFFWENIGLDGTQGKIKNYNSDSWKFNMMNRFRKEWKNREDITTDDEKIPDAHTIIIDTKPPQLPG